MNHIHRVNSAAKGTCPSLISHYLHTIVQYRGKQQSKVNQLLYNADSTTEVFLPLSVQDVHRSNTKRRAQWACLFPWHFEEIFTLERSSLVNFYSIGLYHNASSASIAVLTPFSLNPFLPLLFAVQSTSLFIEDEALIRPLPSNDWPVWVLWILPARIPWASGVVAMEARVYLVTTLRPSCHRCNLCFMVVRTSPLRKQ